MASSTASSLTDETVSELAARVLGDSSLFREILELNPDLSASPLASLPLGKAITLPDVEQLSVRAESALASVRLGVEKANALTESAQTQINKYAAIAGLPELEQLSATINGVFGPIENTLSQSQETVERYGDASGITLIDWLLD